MQFLANYSIKNTSIKNILFLFILYYLVSLKIYLKYIEISVIMDNINLELVDQKFHL